MTYPEEIRELEEQIATLKREHAQLRAAAERAWSALADCPNDGSTPHYKLSWRTNANEVERLLAAALDATQAEPACSDAYTALRAFAERASRMTSAEWTPEVRHELGRILDLGSK